MHSMRHAFAFAIGFVLLTSPVHSVRAQAHSTVANPRFDSVHGWRSVAWTHSIEEVRSALNRAHIAFTADERIGMFPLPVRSANERPPLGFTEVRYVTFNGRVDGRELQIDFASERLREIRLIGRGFPTQRAAESALARLRAAFGPPRETRAAQGVQGTEYEWSNRDTRLVLSIIHSPMGSEWLATEAWQPIPLPPDW
jgi:hypothetical protein